MVTFLYTKQSNTQCLQLFHLHPYTSDLSSVNCLCIGIINNYFISDKNKKFSLDNELDQMMADIIEDSDTVNLRHVFILVVTLSLIL